jgi:hypothetical protein
LQDEWTGAQMLKPSSVKESIEPVSIQTVGNYAVQISWPDGLNQVQQLRSRQLHSSPLTLNTLKKT